MQKQTAYNEKGIFIWGKPGYQTMVSGCTNEEYFYIRFQTEKDGKIHVVKTSEDQKIKDVSFRVSGNGVQKTVKTDENGEIVISDLRPGTYTVIETGASQYVPQKEQVIKVNGGKVTEVQFYNQMKYGTLKILKTAEDGLVAKTRFRISGVSAYGTEVDRVGMTDEKGVAWFRDIPICGKIPYTVEEIETGVQYVVPESQEATILWNQQTEVTFHMLIFVELVMSMVWIINQYCLVELLQSIMVW